MTLISVVVCAYNRASLLKQALDSLFQQTDNTAELVSSYANRLPKLSYFHEPMQGVSHARNRGWREAKGKYVAYLDSDGIAPVNWLEIAREIIDTEDSPHVFGGPYYPYYAHETPSWIRAKYGSMSHGSVPKTLGEREYLSGTNIFFRADVFNEVGGFETNLGMVGNSLGYGEETRLLLEARQRVNGLRVFYEPRMFVTHLMAAHKTDWSWILKRAFIDGRCYQRLKSMKQNQHWLRRPASLIAIGFWGTAFLVDALLVSLLRPRKTYPYWQNYVYEHSCRLLSRVGRSYEVIVARCPADGK
jgi:glycosyltransferase involved in cell wall biosynthesis